MKAEDCRVVEWFLACWYGTPARQVIALLAQEHSFVTGEKTYVNESAGVVSDREGEWLNLRSDVKIRERIVLRQIETGLHLGYHLDPVQGPAGCRLREVSPLPGAGSPPYFSP